MKIIEIAVDKHKIATQGCSAYKYAEYVYQKNIKPQTHYDDLFKIVFHESIVDVSDAFIRGLTNNIRTKSGPNMMTDVLLHII